MTAENGPDVRVPWASFDTLSIVMLALGDLALHGFAPGAADVYRHAVLEVEWVVYGPVPILVVNGSLLGFAAVRLAVGAPAG